MNRTSTPILAAQVDWVPLRRGLAMRPLRFGADGYSLQLRVDPGVTVHRHRHTGEVHAYQLEGTRALIETGELAGPGSYVYEPPGNVDSWRCVGPTACVIQITVTGRVEYLAPDGTVERYTDVGTARSAYLRHCAERGVAPHPALAAATGS